MVDATNNPIDDLLYGNEPTTSAPEEPSKPTNDNVNTNDVDKKRAELLKAAEDGEIEQTIRHIKKASAKIIEKLHAELEATRMEKANAFLTDMLLSKYADLLGGLDAIESSEELAKDLQKDALLKRDVNTLVRHITPFLPFLGIISGAVTTTRHLATKYSKTTSDQQTGDDNKDE